MNLTRLHTLLATALHATAASLRAKGRTHPAPPARRAEDPSHISLGRPKGGLGQLATRHQRAVSPTQGRLLTLLLLATPLAHAQTHAISGQAVLTLTQQYLAAAPKRYVGSPGHAAAETFIRDHFKPELAKGNFVTDEFIARNTPAGPFTMRNFIVKYPGTNPAKRDGIIVIASHYETNYPLRDINFVGANDGGCTTALLIALGQYYRDHPPTGYSVWLLFDDGEEAIGKEGMTGSDQLYGVRHIAAKWSGDGTLAHIKAFLLADELGWKKMNIDREMNSTPWLTDLLAKAGRDTGHSNYLFRNTMTVEDDHIPFKERGVPVLDLIDYEYGPPDARGDYAYHHTAEDTLDKLSAQSLQVAADLFLDLVKLISER